MKAQICPVCAGKGTVPQGFYDIYGGYSSTAVIEESCRSCGGSGYVVVPEG
jgi:DnaJ-class molecular chaperone